MYSAFHWTISDQGSSGSLECGRMVKKPSNTERTQLSEFTVPRTPTTAYMTPRMYPEASSQSKGVRDAALIAGLMASPLSSKHPRKSGASALSPIDLNTRGKQRSPSINNGGLFPVFDKRKGGDDGLDFPWDMYQRVRLFEERAGGLDHQLNIIQRMVTETLLRHNKLEQEVNDVQGQVFRTSKSKKKYVVESDSDDPSQGRKGRKASLESEGSRNGKSVQKPALEPEIIGVLRDQLNAVQAEIRSQKSEFDQRYRETQDSNAKPEERDAANAKLMDWYQTLVTQSNNKVFERLDEMAQKAGDTITKYLDRFQEAQTQKSGNGSDEATQNLQLGLKDSLDRWLQQAEDTVKTKETFEEKLTEMEQKLTRMYEEKVTPELAELKNRFDDAQQQEITRLKGELDVAKNNLTISHRDYEELKTSMNAYISVERHEADLQACKDKSASEMKQAIAENDENHAKIESVQYRLGQAEGISSEKTQTQAIISKHQAVVESFREQLHQKDLEATQASLTHSAEREKSIADNEAKIKTLEEQLRQELQNRDDAHAFEVGKQMKAYEQDKEALKRELEVVFEQKLKDQLNESVGQRQQDKLSLEKEMEEVFEQKIREKESAHAIALNKEMEDHEGHLNDLKHQAEQDKEALRKELMKVEKKLEEKEKAQADELKERTDKDASRPKNDTVETSSQGSQESPGQVAQLQSDIQVKDDQLKDLRNQLSALSQKQTQLSAINKADSDERYARLEASLRQSESEVEQTRSKLDQKTSEIQQKTLQVQNLEGRLGSEERASIMKEAELDRLRKEKEKQEMEIEALKKVAGTVETVERRYQQLEVEKIGLARENEDLEAKFRKEEKRKEHYFDEFQKHRKDIRVMCRIRGNDTGTPPKLETEEDEYSGKPAKIRLCDPNSDKDDWTKFYVFERLFLPTETQSDVWREVEQLIRAFTRGRMVTILCHGQTATGKTYTMSNKTEGMPENDGIMPRTKQLVFDERQDQRMKCSDPVELKGCCYEIYTDDQVYCLSSKDDSAKKAIPLKRIHKNLKNDLLVLESERDYDEMLERSTRKRTTGKTAYNNDSSRSHMIFMLQFKCGEKKAGTLCLVDLAGNEKPIRPLVPETKKDIDWIRFHEGISINQSLMTLKNHIGTCRGSADSDKVATAINGEDDLLTRNLDRFLRRGSMCLMLITIRNNARCLDATKTTLNEGDEVAASGAKAEAKAERTNLKLQTTTTTPTPTSGRGQTPTSGRGQTPTSGRGQTPTSRRGQTSTRR